MKKRNLIFLFLNFILFGCFQKQSQEKPFPVILFPDDLNTEETHTIQTLYSNDSIPAAFYGFNFIGKEADSISIQNSISILPPPPPPTTADNKKIIYKESPFKKYFISDYFEKSNLKLADTFNNIEIRIKPSKHIKNTFPVLFKNPNKDTVNLGSMVSLGLLMEAQDRFGEWKVIQIPYRIKCGNGIRNIQLPPNEIVITLAPIYKGDFKTQLRLSLGKNKSKPYWGYIKSAWLKTEQNN